MWKVNFGWVGKNKEIQYNINMTNKYTLNFISKKPFIEATFTAEASNELDALKIIYADAEDILYDCNDDMNFNQFVEWVKE
mgnify:FL=1